MPRAVLWGLTIITEPVVQCQAQYSESPNWSITLVDWIDSFKGRDLIPRTEILPWLLSSTALELRREIFLYLVGKCFWLKTRSIQVFIRRRLMGLTFSEARFYIETKWWVSWPGNDWSKLRFVNLTSAVGVCLLLCEARNDGSQDSLSQELYYKWLFLSKFTLLSTKKKSRDMYKLTLTNRLSFSNS